MAVMWGRRHVRHSDRRKDDEETPETRRRHGCRAAAGPWWFARDGRLVRVNPTRPEVLTGEAGPGDRQRSGTGHLSDSGNPAGRGDSETWR